MSNELPNEQPSPTLMERVELIKTLADIAKAGLGNAGNIATEKLIEQLKSL
jgi:hypothetical protein